jgi:hypothetical protein
VASMTQHLGKLPLYAAGQRIGALIPRLDAGTNPVEDRMSPAILIRVHRGCRGRVHYGGRSNGTSCSRCLSTGIDRAEVEAFDLLLAR